MVSREAVRKLVELVDTAADIKDAFIDTNEIQKTWQIGRFLTRVVSLRETVPRNVHSFYCVRIRRYEIVQHLLVKSRNVCT